MLKMRFDGGTELARNLASLSARVSKSVVKDALLDGAAPMQAQAKRLAPRRAPAPDLADHIEAMALRSSESEDVSVAVGPTKHFFYGSFVERGTAKMSPHPYMRPAFDGSIATTLDIVRQALWTALAGRGFTKSSTSSVPVEDLGTSAPTAGLGAGNRQATPRGRRR